VSLFKSPEESAALFGSWGGVKDSLAELGVEIEANLTCETVANTYIFYRYRYYII